MTPDTTNATMNESRTTNATPKRNNNNNNNNNNCSAASRASVHEAIGDELLQAKLAPERSSTYTKAQAARQQRKQRHKQGSVGERWHVQ